METPDDLPDRLEPTPLELEAKPSLAARAAHWVERARILRTYAQRARARHASVDCAFEVVERDSAIGGKLLAGALAYKLFVFLLPFTLFLVTGLGLYADTIGKTPAEVTEEAGLKGLIAQQVTAAASSDIRLVIFLLMLVAVVSATFSLYRAIAVVHALAWHGSGRGVRFSPTGMGVLAVALVAQLLAVAIVGWVRRNDEAGAIAALLAYVLLVGGAWLVVSRYLPRREVGWSALVPGALLVSVGTLFLNSFNVYVTTRLIESHSESYGVLGIAAALLFSLVLVGRLMVSSAELNATIDARRHRSPGDRPGSNGSREPHNLDKPVAEAKGSTSQP